MSGPDPNGSRYAALRLARKFRHAGDALKAQPAGAPGLTLAKVLQLHGEASTATLLMLYAIFCVMPVGGVGNVVGVALWWLAWQWGHGRSHNLPARVADLQLNQRWSLRLLGILGGAYRMGGRWMRPRAAGFLASWTRGWWASWIALQAMVIFLPLPLGNVLPALSLVALGLGRLLADGLMLGLSLLVGALGLLYAAAFGYVAWDLALVLRNALLHWLA
ncbi:exopolysaccharide biosynthesis protein [Hydrogenophaga sp.]|uniref:exopolysaccharide biosynthesis protein n=1 Tax=Hydrogenophaga sp. TaxID=1904254 RepID=UPI0026168A90|nr:exopolysaccharide biosynthesis protein [Hydrogenophaga sp.]MDM7948626.1 exopolysaccharide biosynthesis protein [Hydrogenophaga sp.]